MSHLPFVAVEAAGVWGTSGFENRTTGATGGNEKTIIFSVFFVAPFLRSGTFVFPLSPLLL
jgi:hypothetical protein